MNLSKNRPSVLNAAVIVSALGYFVDIYDLILFSIVRVPSLKALGFDGETLFSKGVLLLNMQMAGMLLGGIFWGILGDKKGRLSVLFGSILMYSAANIANGLVQSVEAYALLRFIAGIGLAGELGAGITLVCEVLSKEQRGYGTTIIATVGVAGAILAAIVADHFDWRTAYHIGGGLGLALLLLRVSVFESSMFESVRSKTHVRGDFLALFRNWGRFQKYLHCILIGVPIWFVIGILVTFSPEFAKQLGVSGEVTAGKAVMYAYIGLAVGDLASGLASQALRSRRKVVFFFLLSTLAMVGVYLKAPGLDSGLFYAICLALGAGAGYWAVFVTIASEQFGTNLRATVTTTVPNFVRGSVLPLTFFFTMAKESFGLVNGALVVGAAAIGISLFSLWRLEETFSKDLDFCETLT